MAWERSVDTGNHSVYLGEGWLLFSCYCVQLFVTPWTAPHQTSLSFSISQSLLKLMSIESMMPSNHIIPCRCLLLLPSTFPSMGVCCSESALCIKCPKDWKLSFCISLYNEYSGLISFRIDFGAQENKICHCFHCFPIYLPWSDGTGCHLWSWFFECWVLSQLFHSLLSILSRGS